MSTPDETEPAEPRLRPVELAGVLVAMALVGLMFVHRSGKRARGEILERPVQPASILASAPPTSMTSAPIAAEPPPQASSAVDPAQAEAQAVLKRTRPLLARCLRKERETRPDAKGALQVTIKVDQAGNASGIQLGPSTVRSESFDACVGKAFTEEIAGSKLGSLDLTIDLDFK